MADLSLIIDPGGSGTRPGINLQVFPSDDLPSFQPMGTTGERLSNSSLSSGGFENLYEFETKAYLSGLDRDKLESVLIYNQNQRLLGNDWEIVIYNLTRPFVEIGTARSRFRVPGTENLTQTNIGQGLFRWAYWIAIQGSLEATFNQRGSLFETTLVFREGTKLTTDQE